VKRGGSLRNVLATRTASALAPRRAPGVRRAEVVGSCRRGHRSLVDADGSQLIVATEAVHGVAAAVGTVQRVLADGGYVNVDEFDGLEKEHVEVYVALTGEDPNKRTYDYRPVRERPRKNAEGKEIYARRAATVQPAFGIIKEAMGLRQFLLRGLQRVKLEWGLVCRKAHGAPPREGSLAAELKDRGFGHSPARKTRRLTPTGS